ncbi:MAG: CAP domain-containing protein [Crocinitomicaceae bacterium]|nr:CAP domain-containing protein [Crocinitomicaceae bacterium]
MKIVSLIIVLSILFLSFNLPNEASSSIRFNANPSGREDIKVLNSVYETELLRFINQYRNKKGLNSLSVHPDLMRASRYHAADMAHENYHEHATHNRISNGLQRGLNTFQRISSFYDGFPNAENIAAGYGNPLAVFEAWVKSPGHKRNLLNKSATHMGVGYYRDSKSKFKNYWVFESAAQ